MKNILFLCVSAAGLLVWMQAVQGRFTQVRAERIQGPVVVELFTSQSCSSCPPADKALADLAVNSNIIALGFHVTYWDHLNWKDTLSKEFSTQRQRGYAAARSTRRVYTPQMVVNGRQDFVGSNGGALNKALDQAQTIYTLDLRRDRGVLNITMPAVEGGHRYDVWMYGMQSTHVQNIGSGENSGKTVTYKNAVLSEYHAGDWDGASPYISVPIQQVEGIDRIAVIVQHKNYGPVLAAGQIGL